MNSRGEVRIRGEEGDTVEASNRSTYVKIHLVFLIF